MVVRDLILWTGYGRIREHSLRWPTGTTSTSCIYDSIVARFTATSSFRAISTTSCLLRNPEAPILPSRFGANSCMRKSLSRVWALVWSIPLGNRSAQNPANRGAADLQPAGDFGFADTGA